MQLRSVAVSFPPGGLHIHASLDAVNIRIQLLCTSMISQARFLVQSHVSCRTTRQIISHFLISSITLKYISYTTLLFIPALSKNTDLFMYLLS